MVQLIVSIRMPVSSLWAFEGIFAPEIKGRRRKTAMVSAPFMPRNAPFAVWDAPFTAFL